MAYTEASAQNLPAPATLEGESAPPPMYLGQRLAGIASAVGCFVFASAQAAEAAPVHALAQTESQGSGTNWTTAIALAAAAATVASATTGVIALRWHTKEKKRDRFLEAIKDVAGTSDAAQLQTRINYLAVSAEESLYRPTVFITAVQYLRARRAAIVEIRKHLEVSEPQEGAKLLDRELTDRRNADREMLALLIQTHPAALEQLQQEQAVLGAKRGIIGRTIGRFIGRSARKDTEREKLEALRTVTGLAPTRNEQLINAMGINLDLMRDTIADRDLSSTDFKGAGLQRNNFANVVFEGCNFGEAQLEGTTMVGCDLRGADFRAADFSGDPKDPYFMGYTIFENCIIDANTRFGHRPDNHPMARNHSNDPERPQAYRGGGTIILRNLRSHRRADGTPLLSDNKIVAMVQEWRRNGLELDSRSDSKYLTPVT